MIEIDYNKAVALARVIVAERGSDYVYKKIDGDCQYYEWQESETGRKTPVPSCLVGCVLDRAGLDPEEIIDRGMNSEGVHEVFESMEGYEVLDITPKAAAFLYYVQSNQDGGYEWGTSLTNAMHVVQDRNEDGTEDKGW